MKKQNKKTIVILTIAGVILTLAAIAIALNFSFLKDLFVGMKYAPSAEMTYIRDELKLAPRGWVIFNASFPELKEKQEFNQYCRESENTAAVLGCYKGDKIYVYDIVSDELKGIKELTSAHELLHAVYSRMNAQDKDRLGNLAREVYDKNKEIMGEEIELYDDAQKAEEMYVRAGTEVANLPSELENHFAEIFEDQDLIVSYYDSYIKVFREIEAKMNEIHAKIETLGQEIEAKTSEYESGVAALNGSINEFNNCARTPNCFTSNYVFNRQRNVLLNRQNELSGLYNSINNLINQYNALVTEYNENVLHGQILNQAINSSEKVEGI